MRAAQGTKGLNQKMQIPDFMTFAASVDKEKLNFDISLFCAPLMKRNCNPFTKEEYELITATCIVFTQAYLAQYHNWISQLLQGERQEE